MGAAEVVVADDEDRLSYEYIIYYFYAYYDFHLSFL